MAEKVKLSKDGSSIDFVQSDNIPTSMKKFRQSPEIEGFYRFIFENDLQREAYKILERIVGERKAKRALEKAAAKDTKSAVKAEEKAIAKAEAAVETSKLTKAVPAKVSPVKAPAPKSTVLRPVEASKLKVAAKPSMEKPVAAKAGAATTTNIKK